MKKTIALFLCVIMLVAAMPMGVFAAEEETEVLSSNFDISLPFDDIGSMTAGDYVTSKGSSYHIANLGSSYSVETENGNSFAKQTSATGNGMISFKNTDNYVNFNKTFQISFRMKLDHKSDTLLSSLYLPIVRLSNKTSVTSGGGTVNLLVVGNNSKFKGVKATDTERGIIGELIPGKDGTTTYTSTGFTIYADTWYDIVLGFNPVTKAAYFTATDGVDSYSFVWTTSFTVDPVATVMMFRTYGQHDTVKCVDDVCFKNVNMNFSASTDMNDLMFATGTNAETGEPETYTYPAVTPVLSGFTGDGVNDKWELIEEADGNKYIKHTKNAAAAPITWKDNLGMIDRTPFEVSYRFKWGTVNASGAGMFSVKLGNKSIDELRIINMKGDGFLYFGPGAVDSVKIGQLTTNNNNAANGGAQWHDIKVQMIPYADETRVDMCYRFYIDGDLAAYSVIENGAYNFYTKASGTWTCTANINPVYYEETVKDGVSSFQWYQRGIFGSDQNNTKRIPFSLWDGYTKLYVDGTTEKLDSDGVIDGIASIYMFHYNQGEFCFDDFKISTLDNKKAIETVEVLGYQLGEDKTSVRFIAGVDSLDYGQVGLDVQIFDQTAAEPWNTKVGGWMTNSVYMALNAGGDDVTAIEYGASYFVPFAITDIDGSAIIRIRPYVTKNTVRHYGTDKLYAIEYKDGKITVTPATVYTNDYENGVRKAQIGDGYAKSTYAQLVDPNSCDWGSGGEGSNRSISSVDGTMKILVQNHFISGDYVKYVDENGEEQFVLDENGEKISKKNTMSARYKLAHVVPTDYDELLGKTIIVTAKVKVAEIKKMVTEDYTYAPAGDTVYKVYKDLVSDDAATISFTFLDDKDFSAKGTAAAGNSRNYSLEVSDDWVEMTIALQIAEEFVASLPTINDADGVAHPYPIRPTLNLGSLSGWTSELYVEEVSCYVVPTIAK